MNVYLAARYSQRKVMLAYAFEFEKLGFKVVSRWIHGDFDGRGDNPDPAERMATALENVGDLMAAHLVVAFDGDPQDPFGGRGGRHVEFGMGIGFGKTMVYIGERTHVFHYLPSVFHYTGFGELVRDLEISKEQGNWFPRQPSHWFPRPKKSD